MEVMGLNLNFWKNKRVFITGHTGFKGSWLSLFLNELGCEIYGYALRPETEPNAYSIFGLSSKLESVFGDTRDLESLQKSIYNFKPDIIFHLASKPLVRFSYNFPIETYSTNVMGLMNLLETCKNLKNKCMILNVTSDKCYLNNQDKTTFEETDPLGGNDIYSSSKACAEILSHAYQHSFFANSMIGSFTARAGNVIGGGDWSKDRIITDLVNNIYGDKKELTIRYPYSVRPWQHVLDALYGYLLLIEKGWDHTIEHGSAFNFGPSQDREVNVLELLKIFSSKINSSMNYKFLETNELHEDNKIILNSQKAMSVLKWKPKYNVIQSIEETSIWYEKYYNDIDIVDYSKKLIHRYLDEQ